MLPSRERRTTYLQALANRTWPAPRGFSALCCYRELPILELAKSNAAPRALDWGHIDASLAYIRERRDCQDFAMAAFLRFFYRYPDHPELTPRQWVTLRTTLQGAKYWVDQGGPDSCCWHTENHQGLYHSAELLAGQLWPELRFPQTHRLGAWHREHARERLYRWLDWRRRFSFSEWNSACYYDEDACTLINLAEFAEDPELRQRAERILHQLLFHIAVNSWKGLTAFSQGRAYEREMFRPAETPMATLAALCWGDTVPQAFSQAAILLASSEVSLPATLVEVGRDRPRLLINRERHSVNPEAARRHDLHPDRQRDLAYFLGNGQGHHPHVAEARYVAANGVEKYENEFYDVHYYRRCREKHQPPDPWALPHATGAVHLYTCKTRDYVLSAAQRYRPGTPGYQQFVWCGALSADAIFFTTNPAPTDIPYGRPGPWIGHSLLPLVAQHRNVLIALHRIRPYPIYDQPPWWHENRTHAYLPQEHFDEFTFAGDWACGRVGDGYMALRPSLPGTWSPPESPGPAGRHYTQPYEWVVPATDVAWVCECGSAEEHGSFASFVAAIEAAALDGDTQHLTYESPSVGNIVIGWEEPFLVEGRAVDLHPAARFDNPYCEAPFPSDSLHIGCAGRRAEL